MMTRTEILKSPDYWTAYIQIALYNCAERYMSEHNLNRTQFAKYLGVSKGYVSQLLNGDYDHKISKLVDLSLKFGFVPKIDFKEIQDFVREDAEKQTKSWESKEYEVSASCQSITMCTDIDYSLYSIKEDQKAA